MIDNGLFIWYFCLDNFCVPRTHLHLKLRVPEPSFQCCTRKFCVNANTGKLMDVVFSFGRPDTLLYKFLNCIPSCCVQGCPGGKILVAYIICHGIQWI